MDLFFGFVQQYLSREMEMSRQNRLKVQNAWLKIMRIAKVRNSSQGRFSAQAGVL